MLAIRYQYAPITHNVRIDSVVEWGANGRGVPFALMPARLASPELMQRLRRFQPSHPNSQRLSVVDPGRWNDGDREEREFINMQNSPEDIRAALFDREGFGSYLTSISLELETSLPACMRTR